MEKELRDSRVSLVIHSVAAILMGFLSFSTSSQFSTNFIGVGLGLVVLIGIGFIVEKTISKKRDFKWWFSNGMIAYLFIWFVSWVYFFNA